MPLRHEPTIIHVTGSCSFNNSLITARHHSVKNEIIELLREKRFECYEEVYAVDTDGKARFSDIVAFDPKTPKAYIIDPTIRYETNDHDQNENKAVRVEKAATYNKCIPFYSEKYSSLGPREWTVIGLFFGRRGSYDLSNELLQKFNLQIIDENVLHMIEEIPQDYIPNNDILKKEQKNWDLPRIKGKFSEMFESSEPTARARLLASSTKESSKWLQVVPSSQLGLLLDNNSARIAVGLRLGSQLCEEHECVCGKTVTKDS